MGANHDRLRRTGPRRYQPPRPPGTFPSLISRPPSVLYPLFTHLPSLPPSRIVSPGSYLPCKGIQSFIVTLLSAFLSWSNSFLVQPHIRSLPYLTLTYLLSVHHGTRCTLCLNKKPFVLGLIDMESPATRSASRASQGSYPKITIS